MKPRVFVIHRWEGHPREGWYPWIKRELMRDGATVRVLRMPHPDRPIIAEWVGHLARQVGTVDAQTFFVTHSIGAQAVMRFLAGNPDGPAAGGAVFVAPWLTLQGLEAADDKAVAHPWLTQPIDFPAVRARLPRLTCLFSDDDYFVPVSNIAHFEHLDARIVRYKDAGHFCVDDGCLELPAARDALLAELRASRHDLAPRAIHP